MTGEESILEADHLYHIYESKAEDGNVVALRGLHCRVKRGEAVAVETSVDWRHSFVKSGNADADEIDFIDLELLHQGWNVERRQSYT